MGTKTGEPCFEGEELKGANEATPFCQTAEARKLAAIEMLRGLTPFDLKVVLDYFEQSEGYRLSDCLTGEDLEKARRGCMKDLMSLEILQDDVKTIENWLH